MKNDNLNNISDMFKDALVSLNEQIAAQQEYQGKFVNYSKEYQGALAEEIRLQKEKLELSKKYADMLENSITDANKQ